MAYQTTKLNVTSTDGLEVGHGFYLEVERLPSFWQRLFRVKPQKEMLSFVVTEVCSDTSMIIRPAIIEGASNG